MRGWGRNGEFQIVETTVSIDRDGTEARVRLFSKRIGRHAPMLIQGKTDEIKQWAKDIIREIDDEKERMRLEGPVS